MVKDTVETLAAVALEVDPEDMTEILAVEVAPVDMEETLVAVDSMEALVVDMMEVPVEQVQVAAMSVILALVVAHPILVTLQMATVMLHRLQHWQVQT